MLESLRTLIRVFRLRVNIINRRFDDMIAIDYVDTHIAGNNLHSKWLVYAALKQVFQTKNVGELVWDTGCEYKRY